VRIALLQNLDLQTEFEQIGLAQADLLQARTLANPQAELAAKFPVPHAPGGPQLEWGIAENFLALAMLPLRQQMAQKEYEAVELRVSDAVVQKVAEVKRAVLQVQAQQEILGKSEAVREAQGASLELAQKLHAAGNLTDLRLAEEQSAYDRARLDSARARSENLLRREELNRLLGLWGSQTAWALSDPLPPLPPSDPTPEGLESTAVAHRRDLQAARSELESLMGALGMERRFRFFGSGLDFGIVGSREPGGTHLLGPSLKMELPLWNLGRASLERKAAQFRMARNRFEQLAIQIRSEVREHTQKMQSQREIAHFYETQVLPNRHRVVALTLLQYNAMLTGAFELFAAKREEYLAEREWIEARRDHALTRTALERSLGAPIPEIPPPTQVSPPPSAPPGAPSSNHP
jgi:cobalt-zinc-cadmium efflux system outer membrane protein